MPSVISTRLLHSILYSAEWILGAKNGETNNRKIDEHYPLSRQSQTLALICMKEVVEDLGAWRA